VESVAELDELRAALATRDAELAARDDLIAELQEKLARVVELELEAELAKLRALLGRDSSNSNKPPSSDPPGSGAKAPNKKKQRHAGLAPRRAHQCLHLLQMGEHSAARPRDRVRRPFEGRRIFLRWGLFLCEHMRLR